jgi:hypothetical protein
LKGYLRAGGIMLGGGAFDAKPVLNAVASRGYIPIVRRLRGYGARTRDGAYDEGLYAYRSVEEGIFGALTVEFRDKLKTTRTRTLIRVAIYCLKVMVRWAYE